MFNPSSRDCPSLNADIIRLAFGECPFGRRRLVKKHLAGCDHCQDLYESYRTLSSGLAGLPHRRPEKSLLEKVWLSTIGQPSGWWSSVKPAWQWIPVFLVILLTCLVFYQLHDRPPTTAYSEEEISKARAQAQMALGFWGKTMADTRSTLQRNLPPPSVTQPVRTGLHLALKPFKLGE